MHVLNMCGNRLPGYRSRHDACHKDIFVDAVSKHLPYLSAHKVDVVQGDGSTLRPDSVLFFERKPIPNSPRTEKVVMIVDFKCPYPTEGFIRRTHEANVAKYAGIATWYREQGYRVTTETVIIPSVGPNLKHAFDTLRRIGFTVKEVNKMLLLMSASVAKANHATLAPTLPSLRNASENPPPPIPGVGLVVGEEEG